MSSENSNDTDHAISVLLKLGFSEEQVLFMLDKLDLKADNFPRISADEISLLRYREHFPTGQLIFGNFDNAVDPKSPKKPKK